MTLRQLGWYFQSVDLHLLIMSVHRIPHRSRTTFKRQYSTSMPSEISQIDQAYQVILMAHRGSRPSPCWLEFQGWPMSLGVPHVHLRVEKIHSNDVCSHSILFHVIQAFDISKHLTYFQAFDIFQHFKQELLVLNENECDKVHTRLYFQNLKSWITSKHVSHSQDFN